MSSDPGSSSNSEWDLRPADDLDLGPGERTRSLRREPGLLETTLHQSWVLTVRAYLRLWHRLRVEGRERLPAEPPFVLIANHASHLDTLVLASLVKLSQQNRLFPVAAGDTFFESPVTSMFAAHVLNALPLWRKNVQQEDLDALRDRLVDEPCAYILFPEGTRARDGALVQFRRGIGMLVAGTTVPVVPCYLDGAFEACPPSARIPRPRKLVLRIGDPQTFETTPTDKDGWTAVAGDLEAAVRELAGL